MEFVGWHFSRGEGIRYFFSIPLSSPYENALHRPVRKLFVYTSTGANTGSKCRESFCIIPCFGVINYIRSTRSQAISNDNRDITNRTLDANISKSDFFVSMYDVVSYIYGPQEFDRLYNLYFRGNIDERLMIQYFGDAYITNRTDQTYAQFRTKMGCDLFLESIIRHKPMIIDYILALIPTPPRRLSNEKEVVEHIHSHPPAPDRILPLRFISDVNNAIKSDNYFGVDLSMVFKVGVMTIDRVASSMNTSIENVGRLLDRAITNNPEGDIMNSPYIKNVTDTVFYLAKEEHLGRFMEVAPPVL